MKRLDYKTSRKIEFKKFQMYLIELLKGCENKKIIEIIYLSESLEQLQLNVQDCKPASDYFYRKLKKYADQSDNYIELEKYVIYMDILLGNDYEPLKMYKRNLLKLILQHVEDYFTSDEYCVIRHLIDFDKWNLEDIIALGEEGIQKNSYLNQYFTCEIYLIEGKYKQATKILNVIKMEGILLDYQEDLERYLHKEAWRNRLNTFLAFENRQQFA